jgi:hypothetical protein
MLNMHQKLPIISAVLLALSAASCGDALHKSSAPQVQVTIPVGPVTISGTAATGTAIANAKVEAKCNVGAGQATSAADGKYKISIAQGQLPCVTRVELQNKTYLHSVVEGGTANGVANITPVSELVTSKVSKLKPADLFADWTPTAAQKITTSSVAAAQVSTQEALAPVVSFAGVNPLKDELIAATPGKPGNALDAKLDVLGASVTQSGYSITQLAELGGTDVGLAPLGFLLRTKASDCAGARTGKYRFTAPSGSTSGIYTLDFDAVTQKFTQGTKAIGSTKLSPCEYSLVGQNGRIVFAKSGVAFALGSDGSSTTRMSLGVPEQRLAVSDFVGDWNFMHFQATVNSGGALFKNSKATITQDGIVKISSCANTGAACGVEAIGGALVSDIAAEASSGSNIVFAPQGSAGTLGVIGFKAPDGSMLMFINNASGIIVGHKSTNVLIPANGTKFKYLEASIDEIGNAVDIADGVNTNFSRPVESSAIYVSTSNGTMKREWKLGGVDTIQWNKPRNGVSIRASETWINPQNTDSSIYYEELFLMPAQSFDVTFFAKPTDVVANSRFGIWLGKPN